MSKELEIFNDMKSGRLVGCEIIEGLDASVLPVPKDCNGNMIFDITANLRLRIDTRVVGVRETIRKISQLRDFGFDVENDTLGCGDYPFLEVIVSKRSHKDWI